MAPDSTFISTAKEYNGLFIIFEAAIKHTYPTKTLFCQKMIIAFLRTFKSPDIEVKTLIIFGRGYAAVATPYIIFYKFFA